MKHGQRFDIDEAILGFAAQSSMGVISVLDIHRTAGRSAGSGWSWRAAATTRSANIANAMDAKQRDKTGPSRSMAHSVELASIRAPVPSNLLLANFEADANDYDSPMTDSGGAGRECECFMHPATGAGASRTIGRSEIRNSLTTLWANFGFKPHWQFMNLVWFRLKFLNANAI
jgi:hypothetical protein